MLNEGKMLMVAFCLMYVVSFITAGALYMLGAGPFMVIVGGTVAGAMVYGGIGLYCAPRIEKPAPEPYEEPEKLVISIESPPGGSFRHEQK